MTSDICDISHFQQTVLGGGNVLREHRDNHDWLDLTPDDQSDNTSGANLVRADRLLIHELTHVWQSQHSNTGLEYIRNSVASQAIRPDNAGCSYTYTPGKSFQEYGAEQVASIVEDYYAIGWEIQNAESTGLPMTPYSIDTDGDGNEDTIITQSTLQSINNIIQSANKNEPVPENLESLDGPKHGCPKLIP